MTKYADLHIHSQYSEGALSCREIFLRAKKRDIAVLSITDHNSLDSAKEAKRLEKLTGVKAVSGVEIYTIFKKRNFHLLGYGYDPNNSELSIQLIKLQERHYMDIIAALNNLKKRGLSINIGEIKKLKARYLGLGQIIQLLSRPVKNKYIIERDCGQKNPDLFLIINRYFTRKGITPVIEARLPFVKAIELIKNAGGVAVLAHPGQILSFEEDYIIEDMVKTGLDGIEVYSAHHNWRQIAHYQYLAKKYKLMSTGGSDYHGDLGKDFLIKNQWDYFKLPYKMYENIKIKLK